MKLGRREDILLYALPTCLTAPLVGAFVVTVGGQRLESGKG